MRWAEQIGIEDGLLGNASARAVIVAYCVKQCNKLSRVHYSNQWQSSGFTAYEAGNQAICPFHVSFVFHHAFE